MKNTQKIAILRRLCLKTNPEHLKSLSYLRRDPSNIPIKNLETLKSYPNHYWIWKGAYERGTPTINRQSVVRLLFTELIMPFPRQFNLTLKERNDTDYFNVNPYRYKVANGYNPDLNDFKTTSEDVEDLVEFIPKLDPNNTKSLIQLQNATHGMYSITDIEQALKLLNRTIKL